MATALAAGMLFTSCSGAPHGGAGQLEKSTITVDAFEAVDSAGLFIAQQGQFIASIDRKKVESVLEKYLKLPPVVASVISLPAFPQGVNPVRLQRTIDAMLTFGMLSSKFSSLKVKSMIYDG